MRPIQAAVAFGGLEPNSAAWRARRSLLLPLLPVFAFLAFVGVWLASEVVPDVVMRFVMIPAWIGAVAHALWNRRFGWAVGMLFWPTMLAYGIYVVLDLDRRP